MANGLYVQPDRPVIRADRVSRRHLRVDVVTPRRRSRRAVSLGLVLDRSGSMAGAKLDLAREGAVRAIQSLRAEDTLSVLAYNEEVAILLRTGAASDDAKRVAEQRLSRVQPVGNTDLCAGWLRGCEQVGLSLDGRRFGRCLLLTDGLANQGITDRATIVQHAAELRKRGVTTSTLGVGRDFDEVLLRRMAEAGGGNFYFAEVPAQLSDFIAGETGEAVKVVARDAALVVDLPPGTSVGSPNSYPMRVESGRVVVDLGNLVEDQVLSLILTLEVPPAPEGTEVKVQCWLWDAEGVLDGSAEAVLRYVDRASYVAEPRDREVRFATANAYAARARQRAAELAREGEVEAGQETLRKLAEEFRRHAAAEPEVAALAAALDKEADRLARMDAVEYKRIESISFGTLRTRGEDSLGTSTLALTAERLLRMATFAERRGHPRAPFLVAAVTGDRVGTRLVEVAAKALAAADPQGFAYILVHGATEMLDPGPGSVIHRDNERAIAHAVAGIGEVAKVVVVQAALEDGATSRWHEAEKAAIVSVDGWGQDPGGSAEAFVAQRLVIHASRHLLPGFDPLAARHDARRGCWGDPGDSIAEIEEKLEAGEPCAECRGLYGRAGVDLELLGRFVNAVRGLAQRPAGVPR